MSEFESELVGFDFKDEVIMFAEKHFKDLDWLSTYVTDFVLPSDFEEKLLAEIKETFIERILEEWERLKNNLTC
ncbi:MAG: hypothetical protein QQN41_13770 [Nitrosopumilus sp.]